MLNKEIWSYISQIYNDTATNMMQRYIDKYLAWHKGLFAVLETAQKNVIKDGHLKPKFYGKQNFDNNNDDDNNKPYLLRRFKIVDVAAPGAVSSSFKFPWVAREWNFAYSNMEFVSKLNYKLQA